MIDSSLEDITKFLACKRVALIGVSRNAHHFSRALLTEFLKKGYDAVPVNPNATEISGRKCYGHVAEIAPPVEAALVLTGNTEATDQALRECGDTSIRHVWIYKNVVNQETHSQTVEACRQHGAAFIEGQCPFMFLPDPGLIHRVHRFISKVSGSYPV